MTGHLTEGHPLVQFGPFCGYTSRHAQDHRSRITMSYGPLDFVGNVGVVVLVITYLMLQLNKLSSDGLAYSVLNALGASLIVVSLLFDFNLSALLMEVFWVLISFIGIYRYFRIKATESHNT